MGFGKFITRPIRALLLFGEQGLALYIVCMLGTTLFENSVGFYLAARGKYSIRDALVRVARLPSVYAFAAAVALNLSGVSIPGAFVPLFDNLRGAYSILGMMIIGMGILSFRGLAGNPVFTGLAFFGKFVSWPALALSFDQPLPRRRRADRAAAAARWISAGSCLRSRSRFTR